MKREFLLLAKTRDSKRDRVNGWLMSEKLDGMRAFWDGSISRGLPCSEVPWANTDKHSRLKTAPVSTGLWTRLGQPISAPDWFLDSLPKQPLDGELIIKRGKHQQLMSITKTTTFEHPDWDLVKYAIFEAPSIKTIFKDGSLNGTFYKKRFNDIEEWCLCRGSIHFHNTFESPFYKTYAFLKNLLEACKPPLYLLEQKELPVSSVLCEEVVTKELALVESLGGEGLMLRNPLSYYKTERSATLLKVKSLNDAEATVLGYKWGKPTDMDRSISGNQTDKLLGLMGSMRLRMDSGKEFDLSGFTDAERVMAHPVLSPSEIMGIGCRNPGAEIEPEIYNPQFPRGSRVTFKYRELTVDGLPKEARYWRKHDNI